MKFAETKSARCPFTALAAVTLACAAFLAGCATKPTSGKTLFYPPPPNEPRFQYLVGFSSEAELFPQSDFRKFVVGEGKQKLVLKPYGIAARSNEIYYCDTGLNGVGVIDLEKRTFDTLVPEGQDKMLTPINPALDAAGNLYVTDTEREQVLIYDAQRRPVEPIGKKDEMKPCGLFVAGELLYVTDLKNHSVRIYRTTDRSLVRTIPRAEDGEKGKLFSPVNVTVDAQGKVYVADPGAFSVQIYDAEGRHLKRLGSQGVGPGRFARPRGMAVDREGRLYVVDAATQRVQLFDAEGRLLIVLGDPTISGPGSTHLPAGVWVDYENVGHFEKYCAPGKKLEYVVYLANQYGAPKLSVYGFLKQP